MLLWVQWGPRTKCSVRAYASMVRVNEQYHPTHCLSSPPFSAPLPSYLTVTSNAHRLSGQATFQMSSCSLLCGYQQALPGNKEASLLLPLSTPPLPTPLHHDVLVVCSAWVIWDVFLFSHLLSKARQLELKYARETGRLSMQYWQAMCLACYCMLGYSTS